MRPPESKPLLGHGSPSACLGADGASVVEVHRVLGEDGATNPEGPRHELAPIGGAECECDRCVTDAAFLKRPGRPLEPADAKARVTAVDLFSGCGGLTCGLEEASRRFARPLQVRLAVELDPRIASVFNRNFEDANVVVSDVAQLFAGEPGDSVTSHEARLAGLAGDCDVLLAGPPCQGHSDLNNWTRRADPKNALYLKVARAAEVLRPKVVIVENVPAVRHDTNDVVDSTRKALRNAGYRVDANVVNLAVFGVPQRRRRFLLVASRVEEVDPASLLSDVVADWGSHPTRSVSWAIRDLEDLQSDAVINRSSRSSEENRHRIDYLFEHGEYVLPDRERPSCHRDKRHSYRSVYGRLRWDEPAPTITTGFGSMGQGRYVHPSKRRTITPHEAARLQGFPDWFDWGDDPPRTMLSTAIGNAVPPLVTVALGTYLLHGLHPDD